VRGYGRKRRGVAGGDRFGRWLRRRRIEAEQEKSSLRYKITGKGGVEKRAFWGKRAGGAGARRFKSGLWGGVLSPGGGVFVSARGVIARGIKTNGGGGQQKERDQVPANGGRGQQEFNGRGCAEPTSEKKLFAGRHRWARKGGGGRGHGND